MKKLLKFTLLLLAFILPATAIAHDFEVNGIYYNINSNGASVTYQGTSASQYSNEYSGNVTIPSTVTYNGTTYSVTSIGYSAFRGCSGLTSVTIPNSVTSIGDFAFNGCWGLTSVEIPYSVTCIGESAFNGCWGLTSVEIPYSVTSIGDFAFHGCSGLTRVIVESGNPKFNSRDNCNAIIETASNTLILGCMNSFIPNSVTTIGDWAFGGCWGLTSVEIPNSVTSIGDYAFHGCSGLTSVEIPNSVTSISEGAFDGCYGLTSVTIPNSVTSIGDWAFDGCNGLTSVTIPNSVTTIGDYAFYYCRGLTSVTIGNSVTTIGNFAFYYCIGLKSVEIPNSVTTIGVDAFCNCSGLTSVTCLATTPPTIGDNTGYAFPSGVTNQATLYVPNGFVSAYLSAYNWKNFSQIVGITVTPAIVEFEVDGVWYRALDENTAMVIQRPGEDDYYQGNVVIPESVAHEDQTFTVVSIDAGAFEDCYDLTSVTIGSGVTTIGAKAFNYCNTLQTVTCRGMVPPVMASSNCFTNAAYSRATLRVPRSAQADYSTADYWYKFNQIEGYGSAGPGDVDGDGIVGIADITALIDYRLYGETENEFYFESADLNGNGRIDIADISTLIDMMLFVEN